jgi:transposase
LVARERQRRAAQGLRLRLMFQDEARFGLIRDPRRAWAPPGIRPEVPVQIGREYSYAYAAVSPQDGVLDTLVLPEVSAATMSVFLAEVAQRHTNEFILMVLDGAGWQTAGDLVIPPQMRLEPLPPWSPQLNPTEHLWKEVREKWLAHRLFPDLEAVERQLVRGLISLEHNQTPVASLTGFHWIQKIPL